MITIKRLEKMKIKKRVRLVQANLRYLMEGIHNKKAKKIQIQHQNKISKNKTRPKEKYRIKEKLRKREKRKK